jgi:hypothetical protein
MNVETGKRFNHTNNSNPKAKGAVHGQYQRFCARKIVTKPPEPAAEVKIARLRGLVWSFSDLFLPVVV